MEPLFDEKRTIIVWGASNGDTPRESAAEAKVEAWYDAGMRLFVMECVADAAGQGRGRLPKPIRHLETVEVKSEAVRLAVILSDQWYSQVAAAIAAASA